MGRLVLELKPFESIYIGDIIITLVKDKGSRIKLALEAPAHVRILRKQGVRDGLQNTESQEAKKT